ncbi:cytidylate kinase [Flavobacterium rivuli WB 3.3-2 = DSM 21788]|uniref:Cytidylate kinase n=1 Tax=Flavobacterium rivuli WB 3.3-2 = DSM 21788 TaxID=1121895 RepID=A0A0A2M7K8_9FLAO|nr:(d)CMP kinase [Flavobacterium rivuli]KGO87458.1 cytidylate kinase [Flavobacterium rivuli WB 3.3-2 = DSM 21788]
MDKKITIAIDGFSSTGKSTLAKQLAKKLNYIYVDTGAMYRAVTLYALQNGFVTKGHVNEHALIANLPNVTLKFFFNTNLAHSEVYLNGVNVEGHIRTMEISNLVSKIATIHDVRLKLVEQQRFMGKDKGVVMDGRDIGTVVFPDAELKLFMTSGANVRAQRRYDELLAQGHDVTYNEVLKNIEERDDIDTHREDSPLRKADDAIEIDNSDLTIEEQFDKILQLVKKVL